MASLDNLPADQRAVLQLVLQRGRSYDQIATLLSIDRGAVRARALSAFDALGPQTGVPDDRREVIADYLLGQLEPETAAQARESIAGSPSERAWARVVASELAPLAGEQLPEIPAAPSPSAEPAPEAPASPAPGPSWSEPPVEPAPDSMPPPPEPIAPPPAAEASAADAADAAERESRRSRRRERRERKPKEPAAHEPAAPEPKVPVGDGADGRSSMLGGTVLIALTIVIVAVVAFILLSSGGSSNPKPSATATTPNAAASGTTTASGSGATSASGSSTTPAKVIAQINLTPTASGSKSAGIAEVLKEGANHGIAIVAQNVTPNTTKPPNAYAVWLYNSATDAHLLGFVNPPVGANGRLSTAGALPTNAVHYKQLIVTLESKGSPTAPGKIILQGTLTGL
ncbi:MAG: RNA polymerase sigma factor [Solirubrobacteraceae bacterium]